LFIGAPKLNPDGSLSEEEEITCRMDHYETPNEIRLTVYAKGVELEKSKIEMKDEEVGSRFRPFSSSFCHSFEEISSAVRQARTDLLLFSFFFV